jgi:hypothetical protein
MNCLYFSATLSAGFGSWTSASTAMRLTYPLAFEGRGSALELGAFGLGLAALAGDTPAEGDEGLYLQPMRF